MRAILLPLRLIALVWIACLVAVRVVAAGPHETAGPASVKVVETGDIAAGVWCGGALKQGGLVICRAPPGAQLETDGSVMTVPDHGRVLFGLARNAPPEFRISVQTTQGRDQALSLAIAPRNDPVRRIEGLECDKVDARTDAQKAHAGRSWTKKVAAFARFDVDEPPHHGFRLPTEGRPTSPFGPARTYVGVSADTGEPCEKVSVHRGYDLAAPVGTPVLSPAPGTVLLADPDLYYEGGTVFLDHGGGLVSVFMHLSAVDVTDGQSVAAGDRLGAVGNTGRTTGPHLHWAVKWRDPSTSDRKGDVYIDPELVLALTEADWLARPANGHQGSGHQGSGHQGAGAH